MKYLYTDRFQVSYRQDEGQGVNVDYFIKELFGDEVAMEDPYFMKATLSGTHKIERISQFEYFLARNKVLALIASKHFERVPGVIKGDSEWANGYFQRMFKCSDLSSNIHYLLMTYSFPTCAIRRRAA